MNKLVLATGNPGKLREMADYLRDLPVELALKPEELDIEETGTTFLENARLKASSISKTLGEWALADDSGLEVRALDNGPGVYSARYGKTDRERIDRLLRELGDNEDRVARFVCAMALSNPAGEIVFSTMGICDGEIITEPEGDNGFGYDPIFYVPEYGTTFAGMSPDLKRSISHRGKAIGVTIERIREIVAGKVS